MEKLRIIDTSLPVTVKPVVDNEDAASPGQDQPTYYYLIMGPTGAGKSSFIEALAGESCNFSISKDQLSGYTQQVTDYKLVNVTTSNGNPIHIIDTPGFADTNISEVEVIGMINEWMSGKNLDLYGVDHLFFLTPITEPRLAGSKRRTIAMIQEFLGACDAPNSVTFVTTMWDTLHNQRAQDRAEHNFQQLCQKDGILKVLPFSQYLSYAEFSLELILVPGLSGCTSSAIHEHTDVSA
ncbi:P-loop containing nucleoside triphosphate hydrolase protein [Panaeolus papilionaceus]|nr:P-loop containing nucleoside triphosphate hydrolase protein [Panaeolus papilionaceus]